MTRMRIVTAITALVLIGLCYVLSVTVFADRKKDNAIKVGFVYDGDESAPYTYNFIKAMNKIDEYYPDGRVQIVSRSNIHEDTGEMVMNEMIEDGCDMIITTSYGYQTSAKKLAKEHPEVQFCEATGDNANDDPLPNYHTFMGEIHEGRYVTGIVAGLKIKEMIDGGIITPDQAKVGYVGAFPYAEVISGYTAFILGVRSVVPTATMEVRYTNTWTSYSLEKACAEQLIDDGCIIISQHSDTIGPAVACEEAFENGIKVYHVGYNQSMIDVAPTTTLVSSRINWSVYILSAVDAVLNDKSIEKVVPGNVHGYDMGGGFEDGWVQILDINNLVVAEGTQEKVDEAIERIEKDQVTIFKGDYIGINPSDPNDTIDLKNGYIESEKTSAPSFHYILKDVITVY
ncbi:MAG: BMP family ABC transporter substrate-binding protein [Eubacterium sp.]|nr:BMP family ABC transporter substrate-binding protein [Eubacterium sp.]